MSAGDYTVTVTDTNQCAIFQFTGTVEQPSAPLSVEFMERDVTCPGGQDGQIANSVSGGTPDYQWQWGNGSIEPFINQLVAGDYLLTITDQNDCLETFSFSIDEPEALSVAVQSVNPICADESSGSIIITETTGGTGPYSYSLNGFSFQLDTIFTGLPADRYPIFVEDAAGCQDSIESVILTDPPALQIFLSPSFEVDLGETVTFDTQLFGADDVVIEWTPAQNLDCSDCLNPSFIPIDSGEYAIVIRDTARGCQALATTSVLVDIKRQIFAPNAFSTNNDGVNDCWLIFSGLGVDRISNLSIYDRWGTLVYQNDNPVSNNPSSCWDGQHNGQPAPSGVFVYQFVGHFIDGEEVFYKGDLTLIR